MCFPSLNTFNGDKVGFPGGSVVKNLPGFNLGVRKIPHSNVFAWEIPRQRSLAGYTPWVAKSQI